jgi:hypothetical protein
MLKRTLLLVALSIGVGAVLPGNAAGDRCIVGRVTSLTPTSITVFHHETLTFTTDRHTRYTKLITHGGWQQSDILTPAQFQAGALDVGRLVAVHPRYDDPNVARWVQIATDFR